MGQYVNLNGQLVPEEQASLNIYDHGFMYGDGAFEGIRAYGGRVFKLNQHVARLFRSAVSLHIPLPFSEQEIIDRINNLVKVNNEQDCYIRVSMSRGISLGLDPKKLKTEPTMVISTATLALYPESAYETGLNAVTCSTRVIPSQCVEPRIKSLGRYVGNIQAKMEANRVGAGEGIMLNVEGYVAEATGDNIFIVKAGELLTPPESAGILAGITRATVMQLAKQMGITVKEQMMTLYDVYTCDESFLTGTAAEVIPLVEVDERLIGDGKPGEMTCKLIQAFREHTVSPSA
ncbi:MAG: branched-chain-amino-acid transaminase [Armatimonadota bacterium]